MNRTTKNNDSDLLNDQIVDKNINMEDSDQTNNDLETEESNTGVNEENKPQVQPQNGRIKLSTAIRAINRKINSNSVHLSKDAVEQLNLIGIALLRKIYHAALESIHNAGQKTFEHKTIIKILIEICPIDCAVQFIDKVEEVVSFYKKNAKNKEKGEHSTITSMSGLHISPALVAKHMRLNNPHLMKISKINNRYEARISLIAKIAVAAFIEEFYTLIINVASTENIIERQTIRSREILLAADKDQNIKDFFRKHRIYILRAGVVPYSPDFLSWSKEKRDENDMKRKQLYKRQNEELKPRIASRPGAKARKRIKDTQESFENVINHKTGKKIINNILASGYKNPVDPTDETSDKKPILKYKTEKNAILDIICLAEMRLIEIMRESLEISYIAHKTFSLNPNVLVRIAEIKGIVLREVITVFKKQTAIRLAERAGSIRNIKQTKEGEVLKDAVGSILESIINEITNSAVAAMDVDKKTTLTTKYVYQGALSCGFIIPSYKRIIVPKKVSDD